MVEPEIARRCLSCGASVRQRAAFCPQCGQLLAEKQTDSESEAEANAVEGSETQVIASPTEAYNTQIIAAPSDGSDTQMIAAPSEGSETQIIAAPSTGAETQIIAAPSEMLPFAPETSDAGALTQTDLVLPEDLRSNPASIVAETQPLIPHAVRREPTVSEADRITSHNPDSNRPGVEHNLMNRVDLIRKVSSVVIDQAAYDPSLRFLLVAAVLLVLFVILMVLSKVIG